MHRELQFRNRKGRQASDRGYLHCYVIAKRQIRAEMRMNIRECKRYWAERSIVPYLKLESLATRGDVNR